jgi:hypothetical protein
MTKKFKNAASKIKDGTPHPNESKELQAIQMVEFLLLLFL